MANFFPRSINWLPLQLLICAGLLGASATFAIWYYATPKYTNVGYTPSQPVPFDHQLHVQQVGLDCRYCHNFVDVSSHSNVPSNATCYNCHGKGVAMDSPKLAAVREAGEGGDPILWRRVHALPDYAYFNHSVHVNRGVSCQSCHGDVNEMKVVSHDQPLSMGWCLDCHRSPEKHLRPLDEITNFNYVPGGEAGEDVTPEEHAAEYRKDFYGGLLESGADASDLLATIRGDDSASVDPELKGDALLDKLLAEAADRFGGDEVDQKEVGLQLKRHWQVSPPESCSACHR